jgi:hypothetical protein
LAVAGGEVDVIGGVLVGRSAFPVVLIVATLLNGFLSGISLDKVVVNLPSRRRIGVVHYARLWHHGVGARRLLR